MSSEWELVTIPAGLLGHLKINSQCNQCFCYKYLVTGKDAGEVWEQRRGVLSLFPLIHKLLDSRGYPSIYRQWSFAKYTISDFNHQ